MIRNGCRALRLVLCLLGVWLWSAARAQTITSINPSSVALKMVCATDLAKDQLVFPRSDRPVAGKTSSLFAVVGSPAEFLGQPVAILLFRDYWTYVRARRLLQFSPSVLGFSGRAPAEAGQGPGPEPVHLPEPYGREALPREDPGQPPWYTPPRYLTR